MPPKKHDVSVSPFPEIFEQNKSFLPDELFPEKWRISPPVFWGVPMTGIPAGGKKKPFSQTAKRMIEMLQAAVNEETAENLSENSETEKFFGTGKKLLTAVQQASHSGNPNDAILILAAARAIPAVAPFEKFTVENIADILRALLQISQDARAISPEESPVEYLLLAGELPLTLAFMCPELEKHEKLLKQAKKVIHETLEALPDGAGMLQAKNIPVSRILLASWTRAKWMERGLYARMSEIPEESPVFTKFAKEQYEWVVRCAMHLTRPDGTLAFSQEKTGEKFAVPELFAAAVTVDDDLDDKNLAILALPGATKEEVEAAEQEPVPDETNISEWSALAVMRGAWDREEAHCGMMWDRMFTPLELTNLETTLISGEWSFEIKADGKKLLPADSWGLICKESNEEVEYVELDLTLTDDFRLQRSVFLAKREGFILLADAILPPEPLSPPEAVPGEEILHKNHGIEYVSRFPLFPGIRAGENPESFEISLYTPREIKALALPLALPEWKTQAKKSESFSYRGGMMEYRCHSARGGLFAPIFFDMYDERLHSALTWRRLTVAQKLEKLSPGAARGFRVMVADCQWLIYRSLTPAANRTLLGHNLTSEMLVATFDPEGKVEPILEIR